MSNPNEPSSEQPKPTGYFVPIGFMDALVDKRLTTTEVILASVIRALSRNGTGGSCFASNRYLGARIGVNAETTSRLIANLVLAGVLRIYHEGDQRHLEPIEAMVVLEDKGGCPRGQGGLSSRTTIREQSLRTHKSVRPKRPDREPNLSDGEPQPNGDRAVLIGQPIPAKTKATPADTANAKELRDAIVRSGRGSRFSLAAWAEQFRLLRESVGAERIATALAWYKTRIGGEYIPLAFSAEAFRKKFDYIETGVKRDAAKNPVVVADPKLADACRRLANLGWPGKSEAQIPAAAALTRAAFLSLRTTLEGFLEQTKDLPPSPAWPGTTIRVRSIRDRAAYVVDQISDGRWAAEAWLKHIHGNVAGWAAWNGNLTDLAFKPDNRYAASFVETQRWMNDVPLSWESFMKLIAAKI